MKICCDTGKPIDEMTSFEKLSCHHDHCTGAIDIPDEDCNYNWEEAEYFDNQAFYEYEGKIQLDKLEELPYKEKIK